jgi:RNA polymerase sigma factor (sigma-70 family)
MKNQEKHIWEKIKEPVFNNIKMYLLKNYSQIILEKFQAKINYIVTQYASHLPAFVAQGERDDLKNTAYMEFLETLKVWDVERNVNIWPLAYKRIKGALRDYIRYITKSNPASFYDWLTEATYLYMVTNEEESFETKIENGIQLNQVMQVLSERDRKIVLAYVQKDFTFKRIGELFELSESQISRIYKNALIVLKKELGEHSS